MRIGIVVSASTELPVEFIQKHNIEILPLSLTYGGHVVRDVHDPVEIRRFNQFYLENPKTVGDARAFSAEEITRWFLEELVLKYDRVLVLAASSEFTEVFRNATQASFSILKKHREVRKAAGITKSFSLRVLDTKRLFTREGVIAAEAIRLLKEENLPFAQLRTRIEEFCPKVTATFVPKDLFYLRNVARKRGYKAMSSVEYHAAKTFNIFPVIGGSTHNHYLVDKVKGFDNAVDKLYSTSRDYIEKGLESPYVCLSYGGDLNDLALDTRYIKFKEFCDQQQVRLLTSPMTPICNTYIGPGCTGIALAPKGKTF